VSSSDRYIYLHALARTDFPRAERFAERGIAARFIRLEGSPEFEISSIVLLAAARGAAIAATATLILRSAHHRDSDRGIPRSVSD